MMANPWDGYVPEETLEHYRKTGFFKPTPRGTRPALLVIDVQYLTTGEEPLPLSEAIAYHPMACGNYAWDAIARIRPIIAAFRAAGFPVIYPCASPRKHSGRHIRMPSGSDDARHWQVVEEVAPLPGDVVLNKIAASAFYGTPLIKYLIGFGVDTLFMVGNTTSGCIRASVIDAAANDYKPVVVHDACYDRSPISHAVNLFDMAAKYADVINADEALEIMGNLAASGKEAANG